mmetsp:Transcript_17439/g.15722  ORF Transcript_17439/g.15722 Transcript_17439/m.15722 type:complete len:338 (+) Transcript_17439:7-1020(+)
MTEENKIESICESNEDEFIDLSSLSLVEKSISNESTSIQVDNNIKNLFSVRVEDLEYLISVMQCHGYIKKKWRDYLVSLLQKLETTKYETEEVKQVVSSLILPVSQNPYISVSTRRMILGYLKKWKPLIEIWSKESINIFVRRNGLFTEEFENFLANNKKVINRAYFSSSDQTLVLYYVPTSSATIVKSLLQEFCPDYLSLPIKFILHDKFNRPIDEDISYPVSVSFNSSIGRGTAGAVISLNDSSTKYILTNAHVSFDGLSAEKDESNETKISREARIVEFNCHNYYGSYVRNVTGEDMDYAFAPTISNFDKSLLMNVNKLDDQTFSALALAELSL